MAFCCQIGIPHKSESLHLKLLAHLHGIVAHQWLDLLRNHIRYFIEIFIQIDCLNRVLLFGQVVYHIDLGPFRKGPVSLVFKGGYVSRLCALGI